MSKNFEAKKRAIPITESAITGGAIRIRPCISSRRASQSPVTSEMISAKGASIAETGQPMLKQIITIKCDRQKKISKIAATDQESVEKKRFDSGGRELSLVNIFVSMESVFPFYGFRKIDFFQAIILR